ncbi:MAG: hypothetical protein KAT62_00145 [Desulfuromonadales bacterium]|nr:hypothetical protein [Desulfuromonadales bacterium]
MPLFDINGKKQNAIGKKEHWDLFKANQGSPVHSLLKGESVKHLQSDDYIHSGQLGSKILSNTNDAIKCLPSEIPENLLGSFWGLTLWNAAATGEENWTFSREKLQQSGKTVTHYFKNCRDGGDV